MAPTSLPAACAGRRVGPDGDSDNGGTPMTTALEVAVVTGGARGIGLAIARWFLAHEYRVALWDNDVTTLNRTIAELGDGERVLGVPCDVSKPGEVQAAAARTWSQFGRITALVNNAGVAVFKPLARRRSRSGTTYWART